MATQEIKTYCRFCHAYCPMIATVEDNKLIAVKPDTDNEIYGGYTCIKGRQLVEQIYHPERLQQSQKKQADGSWQLTTTDDATHAVDIVINAMGVQHTAIFPEVEGIESLGGDYWHSTYWNHEVDLNGKRVVIVGSAAAAVQIVPKVAVQAGHLTVLQRTPNWIMPRNHKRYSPFLKSLFRRFPGFLRKTA